MLATVVRVVENAAEHAEAGTLGALDVVAVAAAVIVVAVSVLVVAVSVVFSIGSEMMECLSLPS